MTGDGRPQRENRSRSQLGRAAIVDRGGVLAKPSPASQRSMSAMVSVMNPAFYIWVATK